MSTIKVRLASHEIMNLEGRILTIVDACFPGESASMSSTFAPKSQKDYVKDLFRDALWSSLSHEMEAFTKEQWEKHNGPISDSAMLYTPANSEIVEVRK